MKRVKIIAEKVNYDDLEQHVNLYLKNIPSKKVLDIQYQDCDSFCSVMIVYEDDLAVATDGTPRSFDDIYGKE